MSKRKKDWQNQRNRVRAGSGFAMFDHWVIDSAAYMALSATARALLVELKRLFKGNNNGEFHLSVRMAGTALGVDKDTASRAFHELEGFGFIRPRASGDFDWKKKQATTWILTEYEYGGRPATKDFMGWEGVGKFKTRSEIFRQTVRPFPTANGKAPAEIAEIDQTVRPFPTEQRTDCRNRRDTSNNQLPTQSSSASADQDETTAGVADPIVARDGEGRALRAVMRAYGVGTEPALAYIHAGAAVADKLGAAARLDIECRFRLEANTPRVLKALTAALQRALAEGSNET